MPRRRIVGALARAVGSTVVVLALYYLLPLDQPVGRATVGWLLLGLFAFAILMIVQVRSIVRARHPALRATAALGAAVPLFVLVFASTYLLLATGQDGAFTEPLNHTDALYLAMTVFSTVGFGDIAPRSDTARLIASAQMAGNLLVFGLLARVVARAVRAGEQRQRHDADPEASGG